MVPASAARSNGAADAEMPNKETDEDDDDEDESGGVGESTDPPEGRVVEPERKKGAESEGMGPTVKWEEPPRGCGWGLSVTPSGIPRLPSRTPSAGAGVGNTVGGSGTPPCSPLGRGSPLPPPPLLLRVVVVVVTGKDRLCDCGGGRVLLVPKGRRVDWRICRTIDGREKDEEEEESVGEEQGEEAEKDGGEEAVTGSPDTSAASIVGHGGRPAAVTAPSSRGTRRCVSALSAFAFAFLVRIVVAVVVVDAVRGAGST